MSRCDLPFWSLEEVSDKNSEGSFLLVIHGKVYDFTAFFKEHPGGEDILRESLGKDTTDRYEEAFHSQKARELTEKYLVAHVKGYEGTGGGLPGSLRSSKDISVELEWWWYMLSAIVLSCALAMRLLS